MNVHLNSVQSDVAVKLQVLLAEADAKFPDASIKLVGMPPEGADTAMAYARQAYNQGARAVYDFFLESLLVLFTLSPEPREVMEPKEKEGGQIPVSDYLENLDVRSTQYPGTDGDSEYP